MSNNYTYFNAPLCVCAHKCTDKYISQCMYKLTHACIYTHTHTHTHTMFECRLCGYCLGCASMPNSATVPVSIATLLPRTSIHRHMNQPDREECQKEQANEGAKEIRGKRGRVLNLFLFALLVLQTLRHVKNMPISGWKITCFTFNGCNSRFTYY